MLVPFLIVIVVFALIGKVITSQASKAQAPKPIEILDQDNSATSKAMIVLIQKANFAPSVSQSGASEQIVEKAKTNNEKIAIVIPSGFETGINNLQPQKIQVYSIMKNFSLSSHESSDTLTALLATINNGLSNQLLAKSLKNIDPATIKHPVLEDDFVIVGNKQANISPAIVTGFITSQTAIIPIILFLVIILASQLIAVSVATEKENKTLETLLSSPVSRRSIVASKLTAAGLVALLTAGVYVFGMRYFMSGITSVTPGLATANQTTQTAITQLGLTFSLSDYFMLGLSLFFGILAALSIAIILGSFAEDSKSAPAITTPLMVLIVIPYILSMVTDFSSLSPGLQVLIWLIPFSHPFAAAPNLLLGQYAQVWYGIFYEAFFFVVFVFIAAKIFASDRIFTMKISFRKKKYN